MTRNLKQRWAGALAIVLVALASYVPAPASVQAAEHVVEIRAFKYVPDRLTVEIGDKVTWVNRDIAPHTATASDRSWDTKRLKKGGSQSIIVSKAMTLKYFCRFHPHMKATLAQKAE